MSEPEHFGAVADRILTRLKEMTMTHPTPAVETPDLADAYLVGVDAGRKQAAADIRARRTAGMSRLQLRHLEMAARIAEREK